MLLCKTCAIDMSSLKTTWLDLTWLDLISFGRLSWLPVIFLKAQIKHIVSYGYDNNFNNNTKTKKKNSHSWCRRNSSKILKINNNKCIRDDTKAAARRSPNWRPPFKKIVFGHNSAADCPISVEFCVCKQNSMAIEVTCIDRLLYGLTVRQAVGHISSWLRNQVRPQLVCTCMVCK